VADIADRTPTPAAVGGATVPVFARQSTGLVREISPWRAFIITFAILNLASGGATIFAFALFMYPGANLWLPLTLGAIGGLIYGWLYVQFATAMPRSGGDYVWMSRTLHPSIGFGLNLLWSFLFMFLLAYQMNITTTVGISTSFGIMGAILHSHALTTIATDINSKGWTFAIGSALLLGYGLLNAFSVRWTFRVLGAILGIGVLSFLIMVLLFAVTGHHTFIHNYNHLFGSGAYQQVLHAANAHHYIVPIAFGASLLATPIAFLAFSGFNWVVYAGGEVRRPQRSFIVSIMGAQIVGWLALVILCLLALKTIGYHFAVGISSLFYKAPAAYHLNFPPWLNGLAAVAGHSLPGGNVLVVIALIGFSAIISVFGGILPYLVSRNLLAAAFDRVLPSKLADVSPRFHTPLWALGVTFLLAEGCLAIYTFTTFFTLLVNFATGVAIGLLLLGVAGLLFPYVRKDLFENSPSLVKKRVAGVPVMTIVSALTIAQMIYYIVVLVQNSALSGPTSVGAMVLLPGIVVLGIVVYFVARWIQRSRGIDISQAFAEIPPE
jgi:basic amino acid/polyamine antiporter, APA family